MNRNNSNRNAATKRGPVKRGNMELVHAPGHIFWKKAPKVDKLSLYLEKIAEEKGLEAADNDALYEDKVLRVVERLYNVLFTEDLMFIKMFELPPKDLLSAGGLHLTRVSDKEYECRLFLRRFVNQEAFQLQFGVQSDIPPGMALYHAHSRMPAEQRAFLEDEWAPVMDGDGFMSPAKMYPWFAMGIANAVTIIRDEDRDSGADNVNGNQEKEQESETSGDYAGIEVAGDFPVVRLLFPPDGQCDKDSDDVTLSVANSERSQGLDDTFNIESNRIDGREPGNRQQSGRASGASATKEMRPSSVSNQKQSTGSSGSDDKRPTTATPTSPSRPNAARYKGGRGDVTNRSSQPNDADNPYGPMTVWSGESGEVISCEQDMSEVPLMITIRPAIHGYGLPPTVKLQPALPKQKPYCDKGLQCVKDIQDQLEDGQSMWFLQAGPVDHNSNVQKSARFQSLFRKVGSVTKFWSLSLKPMEDMIKEHTLKAYAEHEFPIDLDLVKTCVQVIRGSQGWACVTDTLIETAVLNVVKQNMLTMRSEGECCLKVLEYLHGIVSSRSCPGFLLPNVNIAARMSDQEAKWVAKDIKKAIAEVKKDPGYVLTFIGYNRKEDDNENSLLY